MFKKICILLLVFFSVNVFATTVTIRTQNNEVVPWKIAKENDGYYQLLGHYDPRKFTVYVSPHHDGKLSDPIAVECNAGDDNFGKHQVLPGEAITCYPHFKDIIAIYIDQFQNGSEGTFTYEPLSKAK
jgi:hypothetical protein